MYKALKNEVYCCLALASLLFFTGCAGDKKEGKVLASFRDMTITESELKAKMDSLPRQMRAAALHNKKQFLEDMAAEQFLMWEAEKRKVEDQPDVRDLLKAARKKIMIAKLVETEVDKKITLGRDEAAAYYEGHRNEFMTPVLLRASHILVKTEEEAISVKNELAAGADFEQTARQKSVDSTAIRGGDLGFFQKGQFVPEFEEVAFQMKKGEVSDIVKSRFGYHIIKLSDRMEPTLRDFKAVQGIVEERLINERRSGTFKAFVQKLKGNTEIKIDEKALEGLTLT